MEQDQEANNSVDVLVGGGGGGVATSDASWNWWWPFSWFFNAQSKKGSRLKTGRSPRALSPAVVKSAERACRYIAEELPYDAMRLIHEYKKETKSRVPYKILNYMLTVASEGPSSSSSSSPATAVLPVTRAQAAALRAKSGRDLATLVSAGYEMNRALHRFPRLRHPVTVWRGTNARLRSRSQPDQGMQTGEHLHFPQFMSTTLDPETALRFARFRSRGMRTDLIVWRIEIPAGFPFPFITQKVRLSDGAPRPNTCFSGEYEVLFPVGAVLRLRDAPRLMDMREFQAASSSKSRSKSKSKSKSPASRRRRRRPSRRVYLCTLVLEGFLRTDASFWRQLSRAAIALVNEVDER